MSFISEVGDKGPEQLELSVAARSEGWNLLLLGIRMLLEAWGCTA